ncbi:unnamed protein product [Symbiodinium natans]|uniref:Uncharacterized protein n=1 Tax=Symbiodinium natans TaxID=878477 RepID=A0A812V2K0_9DINO|nr:unnamed protein product [Symbiodinium natans]
MLLLLWQKVAWDECFLISIYSFVDPSPAEATTCSKLCYALKLEGDELKWCKHRCTAKFGSQLKPGLDHYCKECKHFCEDPPATTTTTTTTTTEITECPFSTTTKDDGDDGSRRRRKDDDGYDGRRRKDDGYDGSRRRRKDGDD